jgi:dihydroorotase
LLKKSWTPPHTYLFGDGVLVPMRAGENVAWSLQ